jgi:hypothetical protein
MAVGRRRALTGVLVAVVMGSAGCGGGGGAADAAIPPTSVGPSPTTDATTSTTTVTEEDAVLAAYQGYWDTWLAANDPPNPDHPDLERYATGAALSLDREVIAKARTKGSRIVVPPNAAYSHVASIVDRDSDHAYVMDCSVDDAWLVDAASGAVSDNSVVTRLWNARLIRQGDGWRVEKAWVVQRWDGARSCVG